MRHYTEACRVEKIRTLSLCGDYDTPVPVRAPLPSNDTPPSNTVHAPPMKKETCLHTERPLFPPSMRHSYAPNETAPYMRLTDEIKEQALSAMRRFKELSIANVLDVGHIINPRQSSQIRKHQVYLSYGKGFDEGVVFPDEHKVAPRLAELCSYMNDNPDRLDRVELAAAFAYGFCMVHPFADGNGRTSRVLANYFLKPGESFRQLATERMDFRAACFQTDLTGDLDAMYRFFQARLQ